MLEQMYPGTEEKNIRDWLKEARNVQKVFDGVKEDVITAASKRDASAKLIHAAHGDPMGIDVMALASQDCEEDLPQLANENKAKKKKKNEKRSVDRIEPSDAIHRVSDPGVALMEGRAKGLRMCMDLIGHVYAGLREDSRLAREMRLEQEKRQEEEALLARAAAAKAQEAELELARARLALEVQREKRLEKSQELEAKRSKRMEKAMSKGLDLAGQALMMFAMHATGRKPANDALLTMMGAGHGSDDDSD